MAIFRRVNDFFGTKFGSQNILEAAVGRFSCFLADGWAFRLESFTQSVSFDEC
jgi:hypothetical protein